MVLLGAGVIGKAGNSYPCSMFLFLFLPFLGLGKDYCLKEKFEQNCGFDEIVMIDSATYGRMKLGRCVTKNYGYIGCKTDVTSALASRCSGRRQCSVENAETVFSHLNNCPADLKSYLEAESSCVRGSDCFNHFTFHEIVQSRMPRRHENTVTEMVSCNQTI